MESTGVPDKIQVSEATAAFLRKAGKGAWLTKREDMIEAKGKGKMVTYWVNHRGNKAASSIGDTMTLDSEVSHRQTDDPVLTQSTTSTHPGVWVGDDAFYEQVVDV